MLQLLLAPEPIQLCMPTESNTHPDSLLDRLTASPPLPSPFVQQAAEAEGQVIWW